MTMPYEYGAQEFERWTGQPIGTEQYAMAVTGAPVGSGEMFMRWLGDYLDKMALAEDNDDFSSTGKQGSMWMLTAEDLIMSGVIPMQGDPREINLPFIQQYYEAIQGYQEMYATGEAPAELSPEETAYLESQTDYNQARIDAILNDIATTGQITEAQQGQLDLSIRELEFAMTQAGIGTQQDWAELELAKQQLTQQQAQWQQEFGLEQERLALEQQQMGLDWGKYLAELQASPADFIQRWYAERLPFGADMPGWITEKGWTWDKEAGTWQPPPEVTEPAEAIVTEPTAPVTPTVPVTPTPVTPTPGAPTTPVTPTPGAPAAGITLPPGMTAEQAAQFYTAEELRTGILTLGKEDPLRQYMAEAVGSLTPEQIAFWTRSFTEPGVFKELYDAASQLPQIPGEYGLIHTTAKGFEEYPYIDEGIEMTMAAMREYARSLRGQTTGHQQTLEQAAIMPYEQWRQTTRVNEWETETDIRRRYESLLVEAVEQGLTTVEPAIDYNVIWQLGLPAIERAKEAAWQQAPAPAVTPPPVVAPQPVAQPVTPQPPYVTQYQQAYPPVAQPVAPTPVWTGQVGAWQQAYAPQTVAPAPTQPAPAWQPTPAQQAAIAPWKGATW